MYNYYRSCTPSSAPHKQVVHLIKQVDLTTIHRLPSKEESVPEQLQPPPWPSIPMKMPCAMCLAAACMLDWPSGSDSVPHGKGYVTDGILH